MISRWLVCLVIAVLFGKGSCIRENPLGQLEQFPWSDGSSSTSGSGSGSSSYPGKIELMGDTISESSESGEHLYTAGDVDHNNSREEEEDDEKATEEDEEETETDSHSFESMEMKSEVSKQSDHKYPEHWDHMYALHRGDGSTFQGDEESFGDETLLHSEVETDSSVEEETEGDDAVAEDNSSDGDLSEEQTTISHKSRLHHFGFIQMPMHIRNKHARKLARESFVQVTEYRDDEDDDADAEETETETESHSFDSLEVKSEAMDGYQNRHNYPEHWAHGTLHDDWQPMFGGPSEHKSWGTHTLLPSEVETDSEDDEEATNNEEMTRGDEDDDEADSGEVEQGDEEKTTTKSDDEINTEESRTHHTKRLGMPTHKHSYRGEGFSNTLPYTISHSHSTSLLQKQDYLTATMVSKLHGDATHRVAAGSAPIFFETAEASQVQDSKAQVEAQEGGFVGSIVKAGAKMVGNVVKGASRALGFTSKPKNFVDSSMLDKAKERRIKDRRMLFKRAGIEERIEESGGLVSRTHGNEFNTSPYQAASQMYNELDQDRAVAQFQAQNANDDKSKQPVTRLVFSEWNELNKMEPPPGGERDNVAASDDLYK